MTFLIFWARYKLLNGQSLQGKKSLLLVFNIHKYQLDLQFEKSQYIDICTAIFRGTEENMKGIYSHFTELLWGSLSGRVLSLTHDKRHQKGDYKGNKILQETVICVTLLLPSSRMQARLIEHPTSQASSTWIIDAVQCLSCRWQASLGKMSMHHCKKQAFH